MENFHFLRPLWFLALIPALWLLIALWRKQSSGSTWQTVFDQQLLSNLWLEPPGRSARLPVFMLTAGWMLAIVVLAGPAWERQPEPIWHAQLSRIMILDLSPSMDARDVTPSRLERARFKIMDILQRSTEGRTGLVVFAGEPHIVTPLTEDSTTIQNLVSALSPDIMPVKGDSAAPALHMAGDLLNLKGIRQGELLLITDGIDDPAAALVQARQLREQGYTLSVLGIGTELGGAIMRNGVAEVKRFNAAPLQELARAGGGAFSMMTTDDTDLNRLLPEIAAAGTFEMMESGSGVERWVEHGVWLLPIIVILAAFAFRRGWLLGFAAWLITPPPAYAFDWQDLWLRADQQAQIHLQQGDAQTAAQRFRDPNWRGMALYESGDYEAAAHAFAESDDMEARYNQGNALARAGHLEQAIDAYSAVLRSNPAHEDARANLELLEKLLQDQQQQNDASSQPDENNEPDEQNENAAEDRKNGDGDADDNSAQQDNAQSEPEDDSRDNDQNSDRNTDETQSDFRHSDAMQAQQPDDQEQDGRQDDREEFRQDMLTPEHAPDEDQTLPSEEDIALEQWLRQIPEDPSGLLRRKFMLEHHQRKHR